MIINLIVSALLLCSAVLLGQDQTYVAGVKVMSIYDSTRKYKPNADRSDKLYFRPIDVDLWYPASLTSLDTAALFSDFVGLLEQRSNFYDDTKNYDGISDGLLQYIRSASDCDSARLVKKRSNSFTDAKTVHQKFPLIIYFTGYNGMGYENYLMFENLVKQGFLVASVSSIGRYPGVMTMEVPDLFEQIKDAKFIINNLQTSGLITDDIGIVGYSWGALAAAVMLMDDPFNIKAFVSLDGSEQFQYSNHEDDVKLTLVRESSFFKPEKIKASYLYLDSDVQENDSPDSVYNFIDFVKSEKRYLKIKGATHEDFSSLSAACDTNQMNPKYQLIQELVITYLTNKLKNTNGFGAMIAHEGITSEFIAPTKKHLSVDNKMVIKGLVIDKRSKAPLHYVNVGVWNKDQGTTTNALGEFALDVSKVNLNDTLRISMVGYESKIIPVSDLHRERGYIKVSLNEKKYELNEVGVFDKKLTSKILGNKTESRFFGVKFSSIDLGSEIAIKIKIKQAPTYLEKFQFNISYNTADTAAFRVNIYSMKGGQPHTNILQENIILRIGKQTGKIELDLSKYNIVVAEDFFISLEWIDGNLNSSEYATMSTGIVFSAGFINKGTYYRKASQGRWKKYPAGVGFNVTAKY